MGQAMTRHKNRLGNSLRITNKSQQLEIYC